MKAPDDRVPIWNIWWTLTVLAAAFGVVVAILEAFGVFGDVGIALGVLSVIATIIFGISASTRSSIRVLDYRLVGLGEQMAGVDQRLAGVDQRFVGVDERLVSVDRRLVGIDERVVSVDQHLESVDARLGAFLGGQRTTNEALGRIEELLRTRLPAT